MSQRWAVVKAICSKAVKFFRETVPTDQNKYIFNISTAGGYNGVPCLAFYSAGKFGGSPSNHRTLELVV